MLADIASNSFNIETLFKRPIVSRWLLGMLVATTLTVFYNKVFIHNTFQLGGWALAVPVIALLWSINLLICQLLSFWLLQKNWLILLIFISASSQYFIQTYGIVIDKDMIENAFETDTQEVSGLLNQGMVFYFFQYILIPTILILLIKFPPAPHKTSLKYYILSLLGSFMLIAALLLTQFQSYAGFFREHRQLKYEAAPLNILAAAASLLKHNMHLGVPPAFTSYATDATMIQRTGNPTLIVLVLGETLRADHLGLNGYQRNTTPKLAQRDLINFGAIDTCGTATAISVPCMFSHLNRDDYDATLAKHSDNILDILQRVGTNVIWRENNSGCKGVCDRIEIDKDFFEKQKQSCTAGDCPDLILLNRLKDKILSKRNNLPTLVVLHQQGNHGPEYYKRSTSHHKLFLPECKSNLLNQCENQHIINAYDNAVVATDELLDETIRLLEGLSHQFNTAMIYVSDHGESLGENGIYLHGLPYWMAPDAQTKVPLLMWLSDSFSESLKIDTECLKNTRKLSHDNLFDSLLTLFNVSTQSKRQNLDFIGTCKKN
jgi:lipid A ethanolaminephosphotransferase